MWIGAKVCFWTASEADVQAYLTRHGTEAAEIATRRADQFHTLPLTITKHMLSEAWKLGRALRKPDQTKPRQRGARATKTAS